MKKIFALLITVVLAFCLGFNAFAVVEDDKLLDFADVLTEEQANNICKEIDKIKEKHGVDVFIVVSQDWCDIYGNPMPPIDEYSQMALEDLQAFKETEGDAGILLMLCIETRDWYLAYTDTDDGLPDSEAMSEYFLDKLGENDYYGGFMAFVEGVDNELSFPWLLNIVIAVAIGLIVGFIVVSVMKGKLKTVRFAQNAHNYVRDGSFNLEKSRDLYLYSTVTRVAKPKNSSSGGGGGSSRSGGGKF